MKKIILSTILIILISVPIKVSAKTTTIKKYDSHGNYTGKYITDGTKTKIYKKNGNYDGYYKQSNNKIKRYSKTGNLEGSYKVEE